MRRTLLATTACWWISALQAQTATQGPLLSPGGNASAATVQPGWATTALGLGQITTDGTFYDLRQFGAVMNGCSATPTSDAAAFSAAVAQINSDWTNLNQVDQLYIPPGCTYLNAPVTQFGQGVPVHVMGAGSYLSKVVLGTGFTGDLIAVDGNFTPGSINNTLTTLGSLTTFNEGPRITGLMIDGNTAASGSQSGVVFYDQNEFAIVRDLEEHFLSGCGLCMGLQKNTNYGMTRESQFEDVRIFNSGGGTLTNSTGVGLTTAPAIGIYSSCTSTSCTSSSSAANALVFLDTRVFAYRSTGVLICPMNTNQAMHSIRGAHWQIEGQPTFNSTGDGIHIGDPACTGLAPYDILLTASSSNVPSPGLDAIHIGGPSSYGTLANAPYAVDLLGFQSTKGGSSGNSGIVIDYGTDISATVAHCNDSTCLTIGAGVTGPIAIDPGPESQSWVVSNSGGSNLNMRGAVSYGITPTASFSGGGGSLSITGTGTLRTVGSEQFLTESIALTVTTLGTATLLIGGIPASATTNSGTVSCNTSGVTISGSATVLPGGGTALMAFIAPAATSVTLQVQKTTGSVNVTASNLTAAETLTANISCLIL